MLTLDPYIRVADFYEAKIGQLSPQQAQYALHQLTRHRQAVVEEQRRSWAEFRALLQRTLSGVGKLAARYLQVSKLVQRYDSLLLIYQEFAERIPYSENANGRSD